MYMTYPCTCIWEVQPIPHAVVFSKVLSKFKAQSSNVSFYSNVAKETFELWALSFETALENATSSRIGCTCTQGGGKRFTCIWDVHVYEVMYTRWYTFHMHLPRLLFMHRCTCIWDIHVHTLGRRDVQLFTISRLLKMRCLFCRI